MKSSVLQHIVEVKHAQVQLRKQRLPKKTLESLLHTAPPVRGFYQALRSAKGTALITEIKRASPSKGVLWHDTQVGNPHPWEPLELAHAYQQGGATCLSVLTDTRFFWGDDDTLRLIREHSPLPLLRKDFIVDPYQVYESRWLGADAILLMASVLPEEILIQCATDAQALGMTALVEIADDKELTIVEKLQPLLNARAPEEPQPIFGINHRDLHTLDLDMQRGAHLHTHLPKTCLTVAESGIQDRATVERLERLGFHAFLVGGHLAAHANPEKACAELIADLHP